MARGRKAVQQQQRWSGRGPRLTIGHAETIDIDPVVPDDVRFHFLSFPVKAVSRDSLGAQSFANRSRHRKPAARERTQEAPDLRGEWMMITISSRPQAMSLLWMPTEADV